MRVHGRGAWAAHDGHRDEPDALTHHSAIQHGARLGTHHEREDGPRERDAEKRLVRAGDLTIDGSVKARLARLAQDLTA